MSALGRRRASAAQRRRAQALRESGLFDEIFYRRENPDVREAQVDPLLHWVCFGAAEGRWPNPLFDPDWYRAQGSGATATELDPLSHYLEQGASAGLDPHPLFDGTGYARENPEVAARGLTPLAHYLLEGEAAGRRPNRIFDPRWYGAQNPELAGGHEPLLAHYAAFGDAEGRRPHPLFDPGWLRARDPAAAAGGTALGAWLHGGSRRGCDPHPLVEVRWYRRQLAEAPEDPLAHYEREGEARGLQPGPLFDPAWYRAQAPDLDDWWLPLLAHWAERGWRDGLCPHPLFATAWYRERHPDATREGLDPLAHYRHVGAAAGADPHPLFDGAGYARRCPEAKDDPIGHYLAHGAEAIDPHRLFANRWYARQVPELARRGVAPLVHYVIEGEARDLPPMPLFDPGWYRRRNPDLATWPLPLLAHYVLFGAREGRSPHPLFDAVFYRQAHPELAEGGGDALVHYLDEGAREGAAPHPLFDPDWYRARHPQVAEGHLDPLTHYLEAGAAAGLDPHPLFSSAWYAREAPGLGAEPPLVHYVVEGEALGLRPNPLFDPRVYRARNPDLRGLDMPLLAHYARFGTNEGRAPHPLFDVAWYRARHRERLRASKREALADYLHGGADADCDPNPLFDVAWYRARHPEIAASGLDPLSYYAEVGAGRGDDPHPLFDVAWYRTRYGEALPPGADPLRHHLERGAGPGPDPPDDGARDPVADLETPDPLFDPAWYLSHYDVRPGLLRVPLAHFVHEGVRRGHRPGRGFDACVRFFREVDPELEAAGPLAGWLQGPAARIAGAGLALPIELPAVAEPRVSVLVVHRGPAAWLRATLRALTAAGDRTPFEVIAIDDDPAAHGELPEAGAVRVLRNPTPLGDAACRRAGARAARGELLALLGSGALPGEGWLDALVATLEAFPRAGIVGARILLPDGRLAEAGGVVRSDGAVEPVGCGADPDASEYRFARPVDRVSGAGLLLRRELFEALDAAEADAAAGSDPDTELCLRAHAAGHDVVCQPAAAVMDVAGARARWDHASERAAERASARLARHAAQLAGQPGPERPLGEAALARFRAHALVVDATLLTPDQDSGSLRMFHLLRILGGLGYHVTFVPDDGTRTARYVSALRAWGIDVVPPDGPRAVEALLEARGWQQDLCVLARPAVGARWLEPVRMLCPRAKLVYDTVDLHFVRRERELAVRGYSDMPPSVREDELRAARGADAVWVVSEADRRLLAAEDPSLAIRVISNVHELHPPRTPFAERSGILFIGGFRHAPNTDAVVWFVREVLPRIHRELPELRLTVIGSETPPEVWALADERVRIAGYVPDVVPYFEGCRLSVAPLRYGAGVKGKLNQSMSHGVPCVATAVAVEGMELAPGEDVLVADDAAEFAARVVEAYRDEELWRRLSAGSLRNVERLFSVAAAERALRHQLAELGLPAGGAER